MNKKLGLIITFVLFTIGCSNQKQSKKLPLIIDADTANEVDDLFALVRAVGAPEFDLLGISSAQFHISPLATDSTVKESQKINEDIMRLLKRNDIPLPLGSNNPLKSKNIPQPSEAAHFIIEKAHEMREDQKLNVVILGSCTNVASSILLDSTIVPKLKVHYLGFWHDAKTNTYDKKEFNSGNDTLAVNYLLDYPNLDLSVMTATTSQHLVFEKKKVDKELKAKGALAEYLINRWETYTRWWTTEDPLKEKWIMWDVAIIEALAHPEWATKEEFLTPSENIRRNIKIYTEIDIEKMQADYWEHVEAQFKKQSN